jgi:hypothetical protein
MYATYTEARADAYYDAQGEFYDSQPSDPFARCSDPEQLQACANVADAVWQCLHGKPDSAMRHRLRVEKAKRRHQRNRALKFRRMLQEEVDCA